MAIHKFNKVYVSSLARNVVLFETIEHEGMVVASETECVRVMSDVYDDRITAIVALNAEGTAFEHIVIGYAWHADSNSRSYEIDASPELKAAYEVFKLNEIARKRADDNAAYARSQALRAQAHRKEMARIAALPQKGEMVKVVVDGRTRNPSVKNANGKTGEVFWTRYNQDGERLGVKFSEAKDARGFFCDVAWVTTKQVQKVAA